ncbi:MAG: NAD(P)H-dependent oxidoreductase [Oscillospiraceae bacterium]|nr:NAD(P)H-dependent oxidoreductase [Oscillospiraceae bacterium]MBR3962946.1 NAD(P)H-dependent oxidoreductase [Oscillospiraceae bacterium]
MKKLLYIDSCIRSELSRTKRIATPIVEKLKERYDVETITINELELNPVQYDENRRRAGGTVSEEAICWANKIKEADRIVIAAPFWDMSIPAALKTFFELCSLFGVTFDSNDKTCFGLCKAENAMFITTRGMEIKTCDPLEQATPYLKALFWLWGIKGFEVVARENFDYLPAEKIEEEISSAIKEGLEIAETF